MDGSGARCQRFGTVHAGYGNRRRHHFRRQSVARVSRHGGRAGTSHGGAKWQPMWLGIDVGTGGTRALLVDEGGKIRAGHTAPHEEMRMERPLWAEQRPQDWWDAAVKAIHGVLAGAKISGREVRGVGLSGQMH